MSDLVLDRSLPPAVVGERTTWARDAALLGFVLPFAASLPWTPLVLLLDPARAVLAVIMAVTGAVLGYTGAASLERMRGQVPIWLLLVLAATLGSFWGFSSAWLTMLATGTHASVILFGAVVPGLTVGLLWLPYTMTRVLRWSAWPLLAGAVALPPMLTALLAWLI